jgi:hypothetical protein
MNYQETYDLYTNLKSRIEEEERNLDYKLNYLKNDENNLNNNIS